MIYHITTKKGWEEALEKGFYSHESLALEKFIHASKTDQVEATANRYYKGLNDLVLLHIDEFKLTSQLKYEMAPSVNQEFPHIYGVVNLDAVVMVTNIAAKSDGFFKIDLG